MEAWMATVMPLQGSVDLSGLERRMSERFDKIDQQLHTLTKEAAHTRRAIAELTRLCTTHFEATDQRVTILGNRG